MESNNDSEFKVGSYWRTRIGQKIEILKWDDEAHLVFNVSQKSVHSYRADGSAYNGEYEDDLSVPWVEPRGGEFWINIYPDTFGGVWKTREAADEWAKSDRIGCIRVPWKEGEGL